MLCYLNFLGSLYNVLLNNSSIKPSIVRSEPNVESANILNFVNVLWPNNVRNSFLPEVFAFVLKLMH